MNERQEGKKQGMEKALPAIREIECVKQARVGTDADGEPTVFYMSNNSGVDRLVKTVLDAFGVAEGKTQIYKDDKVIVDDADNVT